MRSLILLALLCTGTAAAAGFQPLDSVHTAAAEYVMRHSGPGTTVGVAPLDARLRLPACSAALTAAATTATPTAVNVAVRCAAPDWTVHVPVRLTLRQPMVVLKKGVARGEPLSAADLGVEVREVGNAQGYFSDVSQVAGKILKRPLAAGSIVQPDLLGSPLLVRRGELVTLLGRSGAMEIRTQGKALGDGGAGQAIQVQNTASGRVIGAVVREAGVVEVRL